jgi:ABC-type lipoprotein release transport system permease subunit
VPALDAATYGAVSLALLAAAMLAALIPARRAARIDPALTLRAE